MCGSKASRCKQSRVIRHLPKSLLTDLLLTFMLLHWQLGKHPTLDKVLDEIACGKWRGFLLFPGAGKSRPCSESVPHAFKASAYTVGSKASNEHLQYHPYLNMPSLAATSNAHALGCAKHCCNGDAGTINCISLRCLGLYAPPSYV